MEPDKKRRYRLPRSSPAADLRKALAFARETAQGEIESIDRLHKRTLTALGVLLVAFSVFFSLFGWIGYSNLKQAAVQTATDVVKKRLADELTQKNIDAAVQQALRDHAAAQIARAVNDQVALAVTKQLEKQAPALQAQTEAMTAKSVANLQPKIEAFAEQEAIKLALKAREPRQLTSAQREALSGYAERSPPLKLTVAVGGDPEAQRFAEQISQALEAGGWKVEKQALLGSRLDFPLSGLVVTTTPNLEDSPPIKELMKCLQSATLQPRLIISSKPAEWDPGTTLVVLPKAR